MTLANAITGGLAEGVTRRVYGVKGRITLR